MVVQYGIIRDRWRGIKSTCESPLIGHFVGDLFTHVNPTYSDVEPLTDRFTMRRGIAKVGRVHSSRSLRQELYAFCTRARRALFVDETTRMSRKRGDFYNLRARVYQDN